MTSPATAWGRIRVAILAGLAMAAFAAAFAFRARNTLMPSLGGDAPSAGTHGFELGVFLVIGAFVGGLAVALTASTLAVAPLTDLTRAAHAMRRDLGMRSGVRGDDEVGQLGEALDGLAAWVGTEKGSLEEDRNRLATILESMREGVLVTGRDGTRDGVVVLANAALREMLLLDRSILGRPPVEAIRVAGLDDVLERAFESDQGSVGEVEVGGLRPRRLLVHAAPLRAAKGAAPAPGPGSSPGMVLVFNDVTDLRRLESMRRDFVANVSHELRTPITAIRAAAETLDGGALSDSATAKEFVAIIGRHAQRLQRLVEDLLELSKIEARQWQLTLEPVLLRDAASAAIETVSAAAGATKTRIQNQVGATSLARADRRALEQVLVNLVDNAIKYAGPAASILVNERERDGRLEIAVHDDGPGIERRHLSRIFERFYRIDAGRSRAVGGTGLGLSIVKHLVEAMSGTIAVESELGGGTTFTVSLPAELKREGSAAPLSENV